MISAVGAFFSSLGALMFERTQENILSIISGFSTGGAEALQTLPALMVVVLEISLLHILFRVFRMLWFLTREVHFFRRSNSYSSPGTPGGKRILVVGDSTAYGTGASQPEDTIAGRLGHDFPSAKIINTAINGSVTKSALEQLRSVEGSFDLIIVCTGGNDIWKFTPLEPLEKDLEQLLEEADKRCNHQVVVLFYPNLANSVIFPGFIHAMLGKKSEEVHAVFTRVTARVQVPMIELFTSMRAAGNFTSSNPFIEDPEKYYAPDRMHPNSEGYKLWYNRMWREMVTRHFVFAESRPAYLQAKGGAERF